MINNLNSPRFGNFDELIKMPQKSAVNGNVQVQPKEQANTNKPKIAINPAAKPKVISSKALVVGLGATTVIGLVSTLVTRKKLASTLEEYHNQGQKLKDAITTNLQLTENKATTDKAHKLSLNKITEALKNKEAEVDSLEESIGVQRSKYNKLQNDVALAFDYAFARKGWSFKRNIVKYFNGEHNSPKIKMLILDHIENTNKVEAKFLINSLLNSSDDKLRNKAIRIITSFGDKKDIPFVQKYLLDPNVPADKKYYNVINVYESKLSKERFDKDIVPIVKNFNEEEISEVLCLFRTHKDKNYLPLLKSIELKDESLIEYLNKIVKEIEGAE